MAAETPRPAAARTTEIVLVGDAFDAVQRTAIGTAVGEAELRENINRVFVSLSWRSQSLLQRQLRLLDEMERGASSSEELEKLFRLDHLTTRMRRHAEGLVILSGSPTVRAWDRPVDAEDLARAAVAEVEDYTRVEVGAVSTAPVHGAVAADVIHLLAELIENATSYSPPTTEVTVKLERVANGQAAEVIDRGVGLHPDELAELNRRLADAVEFDVADDTDRLGLFVVARLARRHNISVVLQPSAYGGTAAVVLLPNELLAAGGGAAGGGAAGGAPAAEVRADFARRLDRPHRPAVASPPTPPTPGPPPAPMSAPAPPNPDTPPNPPPDAAPSGSAGEPEPSEETGRLPKRVRQRNLAPQLHGRGRGRHAAGEVPPAGEGEPAFEPDPEPDPESSRDLMASLQSGWAAGREADEPGDRLEQADDDLRDGWRRT